MLYLCGQRPPRVSDPEKGKQRKQTKYLCVSSDELAKCPWRCYARWMTDEKTFQCISLNDEHTCVRNFNFGALVNYKWIAKILGDKIRANPDIRLCDIADLVMKKYKCKVSLNQCTNAKKYALTEYENSIYEHYSMLRSYGKAILDSNPGSTVKLRVTVNPDGKTYFDRFYVCFAGLKDGWKTCCRKIIALDDCFLKSPNQGEILTTIGRDGNNHIYLVPWAVGLIEAVKDVMPNAEHKQCCEAIKNGFSECFNSVIVNVRHKPLLTMLEAIIVIVLERMNKIKEISRKWNPRVCPNIKKRLEWLKEQQRFWHVIPAGGNLNEVRSGSEGFTVDEGKRTCSCRMWQLSGLPCVHATKVIFLINRVSESYVPAWFETDMYFVAYHNYVKC
ncbi:multidrug resistance-associated protein 5 [Tanacetum coccineum]